MLAELRVEAGEFLIDGAEALLLGGIQLGAGAREVRVNAPGQALLFGRQAAGGARVVHRLNAGEQRAVLRDGIAVRGHLRRHGRFHGLHFRRAQRVGVDGENGGSALQCAARTFHGGDGVVEGGRRRVVGDGLHFAQFLGHAVFQRGLEVRHFHLVEGRQAAIGAGPGGDQRAGGERGRRGGGGVQGGLCSRFSGRSGQRGVGHGQHQGDGGGQRSGAADIEVQAGHGTPPGG